MNKITPKKVDVQRKKLVKETKETKRTHKVESFSTDKKDVKLQRKETESRK